MYSRVVKAQISLRVTRRLICALTIRICHNVPLLGLNLPAVECRISCQYCNSGTYALIWCFILNMYVNLPLLLPIIFSALGKWMRFQDAVWRYLLYFTELLYHWEFPLLLWWISASWYFVASYGIVTSSGPEREKQGWRRMKWKILALYTFRCKFAQSQMNNKKVIKVWRFENFLHGSPFWISNEGSCHKA